ncbi:hypothetical protein DM02DRAFT_625458 [Periconia macrospinosa]|uniref:Uncharacterized protein n=1 Tax=Periconia macrospinosa TaxID=97972 RepID=A0A2V1E0W8_9PLEO|nr:hypothetical protein DM02DRAFT_625458 [Periconia macrospinosa]
MQGRRYIVPVEPADDNNNNLVIVEVSQDGPSPLDVRLVGCEGENPYVTHVKHANIAELKHKFKGTSQEWEAILSHFLLHQVAILAHDVRFVYSLRSNSLRLSFQQNVKGIKVILGEILLPRDDDEELNPFEWAQVSAQHHRQSLQKLAKLESGASNEQDTIRKLQTQLDDFIKIKNEAEKEMLQQFMQLLNEKKRKIRDQSRLLAGAKIDKEKATSVTVAREASKHTRNTQPSRSSKRKATVAKVSKSEPEPEPEPEQASNNDDMEVDGDLEQEGGATPTRSSDEETEDELDKPPQEKEEVSIPARRELPFGRRATRSKPIVKEPPSSSPPPVAAATNGDETEDEDAEL